MAQPSHAESDHDEEQQRDLIGSIANQKRSYWFGEIITGGERGKQNADRPRPETAKPSGEEHCRKECDEWDRRGSDERSQGHSQERSREDRHNRRAVPDKL